MTAGSLHSLDVTDVDHDGDLDLATCEHKGKDKRHFVLENDGQGRFTQHVIDQGEESRLGTLLFDLDGDLDILSVAWDEYRFLLLWRNDALKPLRWEAAESRAEPAKTRSIRCLRINSRAIRSRL